jgi:calcium permeable stress-gated cation channel
LSAGINSPSLATLVATVLPVTAYSTICILIFLTLRARCPRVYSPRTTLKSLDPHERGAPLSKGIFKWFRQLRQTPDSFILNHGSIDGFLFLRFLKILILIFGVGCAIASPVLLPIHATGNGGNNGLDILTMGNITDKTYYYAHAAVAWAYFGFILYIVTRESIFCIHLRHVCLTSPFYADRLSARTVLVTSLPHDYLHELTLQKIFGGTVKRVWIPRHTDDLQDLVNERQQTAARLEKAELRLITIANTARSKALGLKSNRKVVPRKDEKQAQSTSLYVSGKDEESPPVSLVPLPDVSGSVAAQWISHSSRPVHRPLANAARRVDTIKWTRNRLRALAKRILKERLALLQSSDKAVMPAAFIEFASQADAQVACQTLSYHQPLYMAERLAGVRPYEIVWSSLTLSQLGRMCRKFAMQAFVAVLVIFWAIPCAFVGMVSNIESLSYKISFLGWIRDLPSPILGVLTGLVPALALAWVMNIVPWILRMCAKVAGTPTLSMVEVYTQKSYIIFQIVQVFLVTTLTSAVSAALTQILENPMSATTLLSQNLPKSSNFYISYILVQCLVLGAANLVRFFDILRYHLFPRLPHDHRKRYERFHHLPEVHWGAVFPVFTNLGIIGICYACIAPLILAFATLGVAFIYIIFRYNILHVYNTEVDTRGLLYPAALMQLIWGLYLAEVCLIGLFSLQAAAGPIGMTVALLVVTILVHRALLESLGPLLFDLPKSLAGPGTAGLNGQPVDPFSQAIAEHHHDLDPSTGRTTSSDHPLFADIAEDDGPEHLPGAPRGGGGGGHSIKRSSNSTYRYTIAGSAAHKDEHDIQQQSSDRSPPAQNNPELEGLDSEDDEGRQPDQEAIRSGMPTTDPSATSPFRLEGLMPILKTFSSAGSKMMSSKLLPYRTSFNSTLSPLISHRRFLSFRKVLSSLSPLYYASINSPIPDLIAQLRDLDPPQYSKELYQVIYLHPSMYAPAPRIWVPRDPGGISKQEVEHNNRLGRGVVECSDEAWDISEQGKLRRDLGESSGVNCWWRDGNAGYRGRW